jgi:hypothetical protein
MGKNKKQSATESGNSSLIEKITKIKKDNPSWGYRRVWTCLVKTQGVKIDVKTVYRLMKARALLLPSPACLDSFFSGKKNLHFFVTISSDFSHGSKLSNVE